MVDVVVTVPKGRWSAWIAERFGTPNDHLDNRDGLNHLGVCSQRRQWVGGERVPDGTGFRMENQPQPNEHTLREAV